MRRQWRLSLPVVISGRIPLQLAFGMAITVQVHRTKNQSSPGLRRSRKDSAHECKLVSTVYQDLSRFQREARMLAALNHPNIATIHEVEHSDGVHYLVTELVPGETVAERIRKGSLPLAETLRVARGIEIHRILASYINHLLRTQSATNLEVSDSLMIGAYIPTPKTPSS
jgi:serine/threonine protein kinase